MGMSFSCLRATKEQAGTFSIRGMLLCVAIFLSTPVHAAEQGLSITIAPPLFQINLQPGETWSSGITVVNNNAYDLTLYAEPTSFEPSGESGRPVFLSTPTNNAEEIENASSTLARWITVPQNEISIKREKTYVLPITIQVPKDASPGGHYAAILIGNRAPQGSPVEGGSVNVTSSVASLIFLSVAGDVIEKGRIRDFVTEKSIYETPEANFSLRFENQGNVHLIPKGNIVIYNMFGKVRGNIPVNHQKNYGNVLPNSVRKFSFTWKSDASMWDIGRYRAEVTIGYGKEQKQSALGTTYFYVLPVVPLLQIVGGLLVLVFFVGWVLRLYIRRALALETAHLQVVHSSSNVAYTSQVEQNIVEAPRIKLGTLIQPIKAGLIDLRNVGTTPVREVVEPDVQAMYMPQRRPQQVEALTLGTFLYKYWLFFISVFVVGIGGFALSLFFEDVMTVSREYSFSELRPDGSEVDLAEDKNTTDDLEN